MEREYLQKKYDKKILVITHQLSRTGAPIVLLDMIRVYQKQGYNIDVITMLDGELGETLAEMNISVSVQEQFIGQAEEFYQLAREYDMVIANTLITYEVIHILNHSEIPVLWWLHEGRQYFEYFASVLPDFSRLSANIHVFSVGHYVQNVVSELYGYHTEILHFGVEDVPVSKKEGIIDSQEVFRSDKVKFLTAGTYSKVKAQDILVEAIRLLPGEYLAKAEFFFCGNEQMYDEEVYLPVKRLSAEYDNVTMLHQLSHEEMLKCMEACDCLIVPSRIDPIPTVAVEMMMKENSCLCTEVCGVAHYLEDGVNGFTVPPEDAGALRDKMKYIIDNRESLKKTGTAGRKIYEEHFSPEVFEPFILRLADEYTHPGETNMKELAHCILQIEQKAGQGLQLSDRERKELANSISVVKTYIRENYVIENIDNADWIRLFVCG